MAVGTVPIPLRCDRTPHVGLRHRATEAFNVKGAFNACPGTGLQGMWNRVRARGALRLRSVLRPARSALRPRLARRRVGEAADPGRSAEPLALLRLPAVRADAQVRAASRLHAARSRAAAGGGARAA